MSISLIRTYSMCRLVFKDVKEGKNPQVLKDLLFIVSLSLKIKYRDLSSQVSTNHKFSIRRENRTTQLGSQNLRRKSPHVSSILHTLVWQRTVHRKLESAPKTWVRTSVVTTWISISIRKTFSLCQSSSPLQPNKDKKPIIISHLSFKQIYIGWICLVL